MAVLTQSDKADMAERIFLQSLINTNQVYWMPGAEDFKTMIWHYLDVHKVDRFTHKGSELALAGCTDVYQCPWFTLGIRNGSSLEIFLERV